MVGMLRPPDPSLKIGSVHTHQEIFPDYFYVAGGDFQFVPTGMPLDLKAKSRNPTCQCRQKENIIAARRQSSLDMRGPPNWFEATAIGDIFEFRQGRCLSLIHI